jgi:hypothetical protein
MLELPRSGVGLGGWRAPLACADLSTLLPLLVRDEDEGH